MKSVQKEPVSCFSGLYTPTSHSDTSISLVMSELGQEFGETEFQICHVTDVVYPF